MKIRTPKNEKGKKINLFPCKAKELPNRLLKLNTFFINQGYEKSWHYKENGEVYPF